MQYFSFAPRIHAPFNSTLLSSPIYSSAQDHEQPVKVWELVTNYQVLSTTSFKVVSLFGCIANHPDSVSPELSTTGSKVISLVSCITSLTDSVSLELSTTCSNFFLWLLLLYYLPYGQGQPTAINHWLPSFLSGQLSYHPVRPELPTAGPKVFSLSSCLLRITDSVSLGLSTTDSNVFSLVSCMVLPALPTVSDQICPSLAPKFSLWSAELPALLTVSDQFSPPPTPKFFSLVSCTTGLSVSTELLTTGCPVFSGHLYYPLSW